MLLLILFNIFYSSFNSFLFEIKFLVYGQNLFFFMKLAISFMVTKFACSYLAVKFFAFNLLNSSGVIYLS